MEILILRQSFGKFLKLSIYPIIILGLLIGFTNCTPEFKIENPYDNVDWDNFGRFKAELHAHSTWSDGYYSPHVVVDRYHELGYDILAFAEHGRVNYPWQEFTTREVSGRTYRRLEEGQLDGIRYEDSFVYEDRDPDSLGMLAIQANEVSHHHHMGSYFSDHADGRTASVAESLEAIAEKNGVAVLFHPGNLTRENQSIDWYVDHFQRYDHLIGMEAYNNGFRNNPRNLNKWDSTLIRLMPDRPVWGFSNDDFHGGIMGRNWNVFLLPELSLEEFRKAMENGMFYFVYAPEGHDGPPPPEINSIEVNSRRGTIYIDASDYQYIEWISDNAVVYVGDKINLFDLPEVGSYVRANIYQSKHYQYHPPARYQQSDIGAVTVTQPFGIWKK